MNDFALLREPHISEKATLLKEVSNVVTFKVHLEANKPQIKKAVEKIFKVKVLDVRTIQMDGKQKRRGARVGYRRDWKKAYVTLDKSAKIDYFEGG